MKFMEKSCREFTEALAGKDAVPGGGAASALAGALGIALSNMVGQLTLGKKKYADVEEDIKALMDKAAVLKDELLQLAEKDAEVFEPLSKAYGMPKDTPEQIAEKERVMAEALEDACSVPIEIMRKCGQIIDLQAEFAAKGSRLAISDAGVGVIFTKSALQGSALNVFINTKIMKDRNRAQELNREADELLFEYTVKADEVYASVFHALRDEN